MHVAAGLESGDIECAQMLLKSGAQPNVKRSDGLTPLHIAARAGNSEMVRLLLNEGADVEMKSKVHLIYKIKSTIFSQIGETALHFASKYCHLPIVLLLLEHLSKNSDNRDVKNYVNSLTDDGQTSVHYANQILPDQVHFKEEDARIVSTLVDYGGDCELQTLNVRFKNIFN